MPEPVTFFDHQENAKRRSYWALIGFAITVLLTAAAVSLFGGLSGLILMNNESGISTEGVFKTCAILSGCVTLVVIFISWAWKASVLAAGPEGIMKSMGAWKVSSGTNEPDQRQLLNLVEEMSIASGVPIPDVYIMDSPSINACAVGMEVDKAAVAVTRGAIVKLNRSELQGVVAHEFSHILHGDMSLNTHMVAWLAGLFTISEMGRMLMEAVAEDDSDSIFSSSTSRGKGAGFLIFIGAGIWLLGSIGVFFGKLLQSSTSRQREFLADASAIQYTRNPDGLANALRKLGQGAVRGRMTRPPNDCGHMMFSQLRSRNYTGSFSTHPPLPIRIKRILPSWDGSYLETMELKIQKSSPSTVKKQPIPYQPKQLMRNMPSTLMLLNLLEEHKMPDTVRLQAVRAWVDHLDEKIVKAAHDPDTAQNLMFVMLLQDEREKEWRALQEVEDESRLCQVKELLESITIDKKDRLGIVDLALPALRQISEDRRKPFIQHIKVICDADGTIDLFEYCLLKILDQNMEPPKGRTTYQRMRVHIRELETDVNVMLSSLSRLGSETEEEVARCFAKAEERMFGFTAGIKLTLLPSSACGLDALDQACEKLPGLAPNFQQRLLLAGLAAIAEDDHLHADELQAFRAFAAVMRIPVPPGLGMV